MADTALLIGDVVLGEHASVWFGAVVRADTDIIRIGRNTNIQDGCVLHTDLGSPVSIGRNVTVGHGAIIHGCTIRSNCVIGMGATILSNAEVGDWCVIGAGSLVTSGMKIPARSVAMGVPAKVVRPIHEGDKLLIKGHYMNYLQHKKEYLISRK